MYGTPTDPVPYLALAYGLGGAILLGYGLWSLWDQKRLRQLQNALDGDQTTKEATLSRSGSPTGEQANG